jgi:hypothetical protein
MNPEIVVATAVRFDPAPHPWGWSSSASRKVGGSLASPRSVGQVSGPRSAHTINRRRTDVETTRGRRGKIYAMDTARLGDEAREMRWLQIEKNEEHVTRAREIVRAFYPQEIERDTNVSDMLCNLMHLCAAEGWDFDAQIEQGRFNFEAESGDDPSEWMV